MISDYDSLKTAIAAWLARSDLTAQIPTFIQLAEQRFCRELRVRQMQTTDTGLVSGGAIPLPSDCREVQSLRIAQNGYDRELPPLPPSRLHDSAYGWPIGYVAVGNSLQVIGEADGQVYTLTYMQEFPDLATAPMSRNWLIQREPGLYLYGALVEASPYLGDDTRALVWNKQYENILVGMHAEDDRTRYGNAPAMRVSMP